MIDYFLNFLSTNKTGILQKLVSFSNLLTFAVQNKRVASDILSMVWWRLQMTVWRTFSNFSSFCPLEGQIKSGLHKLWLAKRMSLTRLYPACNPREVWKSSFFCVQQNKLSDGACKKIHFFYYSTNISQYI